MSIIRDTGDDLARWAGALPDADVALLRGDQLAPGSDSGEPHDGLPEAERQARLAGDQAEPDQGPWSRADVLSHIAMLCAGRQSLPVAQDTVLNIFRGPVGGRWVELRLDRNDQAGVDAWAAWLGIEARLDDHVFAGAAGGRWQSYIADSWATPWPGWDRVKIWCPVDRPDPEPYPLAEQAGVGVDGDPDPATTQPAELTPELWAALDSVARGHTAVVGSGHLTALHSRGLVRLTAAGGWEATPEGKSRLLPAIRWHDAQDCRQLGCMQHRGGE